MGNLKDEDKKIDPLFPRLHITDTDKGGPKTPPRNKIALSHHHQQLNVPSQRCIPGSVSPILPLSTTNNGTTLLPATHDASYKRSVFSSFGSSCGSTRLATRLDSYHSSGINLNISLTTVKQTIESTNCQTLCNGGHLKRGDYCLFKPQDYRSTRSTSVKKPEDDGDDYLVPSLSFGNGQNRGKFPTLNTNSHINHPTATQTQDNKLNTTMIKDIAKEPMSYYSDRVRFSEMLSGELAPSNPRKRSILVDEPQMLQDSSIRLLLKRKNLQETMAYKDGILVEPLRKSPLLGEDHKTDQGTLEVLAPISKSKEDDHGSLQLGDVGKIGDISETNFISCYNIIPEEVSQMIGPEQYCKARRTIIQQQKVFHSQLFELHRLIKVQKLLAESPDLVLEDSFYKLKKMASEDIFPIFDHQKKESCLSFPIDNTIRKPLHINNDTDKRYNPNPLDLPPASTAKQPPWCFLPPPGNQWLVPVRSPSEGLVYKPYTGPCPPPVGLMAPIYGMSLQPSNGDILHTPTSYNQQGVGAFPITPLFPSKRSCSPTMDGKPIKTSCNIVTPEKWGSSCSGEVENKESDELPLFPTTPMVQESDECTDDERIKVIKVVPHNPKLASESAARIFQFIQEERKQYD